MVNTKTENDDGRIISGRSRKPASRIGFMEGDVDAPDDFDRMSELDIEKMFDGTE
jgi:hypothetical protein